MWNKIMFSSMRLDWQTPRWIFQALDREFHFDFDPCPNIARRNVDFDGLTDDWKRRNFVNPPYGREIGKWIKKGFGESRKDKLVVFLIPSRTDTSYWHDYVMFADEIRFIRGRLKFKGAKNSAPFPSCIAVFRPH